MFPVIDSAQSIVESAVSKGSLITFLLKFPCTEFQLNPLNFNADTEWNILETNRTNDTILCWVKPGISDSLTIEFVADAVILDTIDFVINKVNPNIQVDSSKVDPLIVYNNLDMGVIELNERLRIESEDPLSNYDFSGFNWYQADTICELPPIVFKDSAKRIFYFDVELEEEVDYKLIIPDSSMADMIGRTNDSLVYRFKTKPKEEYGTIMINVIINDTIPQWIFQIIDKNQKIVGQQIANQSKNLTFDFVVPDTYSLKAIRDDNKNGYWDTGNYIRHRQAEKVLIFNTELEVRANWVMEENWEVK